MKRLLMVRHAKSSWDEAYVSDFERPLNKRGRRDAPLMGAVLRNQQVDVQYLRSSPAVRALTTARLLAEELSFPLANIVTDDSMYGASALTLQSIIRAIPDSVAHAMIVGHNPGMHALAETLVDFREVNLPTCGIVCADFPVDSWAQVGKGTGRLAFYEYPKRHTRD
ncbi:MAG: histidine phosphatase family protein [Bacteroidia bacterium]|nr:histidine phosphatase family protein [Bacteroidia bacterium]